MVSVSSECFYCKAENDLGVDACNTVLEVLLFAAAMNLGQSWNTVLTLFGGRQNPIPLGWSHSSQLLHSHTDFLCPNMGRVLYPNSDPRYCLGPC